MERVSIIGAGPHGNKVTRAEIHGKNTSAKFCMRSNMVVDRRIYDDCFRKRAEDAGVKFHLGHRFEGMLKGKMIFKTDKGMKGVKADTLIGADGPNSAVAKSAG